MPSALENLLKIIRLEQKNGYDNRAVIGGLLSYAPNWAQEAHTQARRPDQHALVDELLQVIQDYQAEVPQNREALAEYIVNRITRRAEALPQYAIDLSQYEQAGQAPEAKEALLSPSAPEPAQAEKIAPPQPTTPPPTPGAPPSPRTRGIAPKPRRRRQNPDLHKAHDVLAALEKPVTTLSGIGEVMAEKLARLGVQTISDMLYLFPRRYDDYTRLLPISHLRPGQTVTVVSTVRTVFERVGRSGHKVIVLKTDDGTGSLEISFFNQPWLRRQVKPGMQLVFSGKTDLFQGRVVMNNPEWEAVDQNSLKTGAIVPVYPLTKGISARTMRRLVAKAVETWASKIPDYMPDSVLERTEMVALDWALRQMHMPERMEFIDYARERLAFDELMLLQLGTLTYRREWQSQPADPTPLPEGWLEAFQESLPFPLTGAQRRAIEEINADMGQPIPMNRLLQGDVGSGKTMVAAVMLAAAVLNGKQAALMAPTSILAEQHYQKISALFQELPGLGDVPVVLLTGAISESERRAAYAGLAEGTIGVVIGTHAVIQGGVDFAALGAVVIDEQHRFGVEQRAILRGKGTNPHVLIMSATPIPRTLALSLFADLDLSTLDEMPPGRIPIQTRLITPEGRTKAYLFIEEHVLKKGHQAYVIYPLVEASESETMQEVGSAVEGHKTLQREIFPNYKIGLIHGRMKPAEKDAVMAAFAAGELHILVSTTVIEVGVDVPNATAILIEDADRFGLAQLHQLRGRVGRGGGKAYCLLIAGERTERLEAMEQTTDGFALANLDWQLRGAGDLVGLRQSGGTESIKLASVMDAPMVELAQQESRALFAEDSTLSQYPLLAQRVAQVVDRRSDLS